MNQEKYLPLGTVVMLKNGRHRVMIVGYCFVDPEIDNRKMFDYIGSFYPEGIFSLDKIMAFNHSDIEKIYFVGCSDEDYTKFTSKLVSMQSQYVDANNNLKVDPSQIIMDQIV